MTQQRFYTYSNYVKQNAEWISIMVPCHACFKCTSIGDNYVQYHEAALGGKN